MSSKLQLTTLAVLVSAALPAQAALYKVVEVDSGLSGPEIKDTTEYYGTAIQPGMTANPKGCFTDDCGTGTAYKLAGEIRNRPEGFSYREEVPFAMGHSFSYIEDDYDGFKNYCFDQLGYSTCESWAETQYSKGWYVEKTNNSKNSIAFVEGSGAITTPTTAINSVVNSFSKVSGSVSTIGNYSDSTSRNLPISGDTITGWKQGRQWASDGTYTVGSVSSKTGIASSSTERYDYYSKAAIWIGGALTAVNWFKDTIDDGGTFAQGSIRDFYTDGTTFYAVGYNNYDGQDMDATIFSNSISNLPTLLSTSVGGANAGNDNIYTNSVVTNINANLVAVGQAKLSGYDNRSDQGARPNKLFVISDVKSPTAIYLSGISNAKSVFFNSGAGGQMGGINNFNEIVGRVDVENHRETDGKQRRQRAFIYPYGVTAKVPDQATKDAINARRAIIGGEAQLIDNLTNGGSVSNANNQFRIYDASDINDAGVISATALKCVGGYDSVASDSYCGNGSTAEKIVAVKLVPIAGATASDIQARPFENSTIERQGGSLGFGALTLLGLFGFMRKRIK